MTRQRGQGFTLMEMLVVILIMMILLLVALPGYQRQVQAARRLLGSAALLETRARQERFFLDHRRYAPTLGELGFPDSPYAIDPWGNRLPADSPSRIYLIELASHSAGYALHAHPQLGQASDTLCGTLSLSATGLRSATGDGTARRCW